MFDVDSNQIPIIFGYELTKIILKDIIFAIFLIYLENLNYKIEFKDFYSIKNIKICKI